ncbi:MAG: glycosyltransferase family 39 protein [Chloroflexi bacterium]|nr:glycosyltransferase family 39 protein [Chloroflexota bacterium]
MHRHHWILLGLLLAAFAIRLAYWERSASFGHYDLSYDDDEYFKLGVLFARGEFFRDPYPLRYTRAPGLPLFFAPSFAAFGPRLDVALVFQVCVSVMMVALTYTFARRAIGKRAAVWAMALMAFAPIYASSAGSFILTETLFSFCILLFIYLFARWSDEGMTLPRALGCGLLLGYSALIRPIAVYFLVVAALWFLYTQRARWKWALPRVALVAVGMFALILPYTLRNYIVYERVMLIDSISGWTMWRDHRAPNDDFWTTLPTIANPGDRDRYAFQRGVQNVLADPVQQIGAQGLANLAATMRLELDSFARGAGYLTDAMVDAPTLPLVLLNDLYYLFVVIFGIAGIVLTWRKGGDHEGGDHEGGDHKGGDHEGGDHKGGDHEGGDHKGAPLLLWLAYFGLIVFVYHTQSRFRPHYTFVFVIFAGAALAQGFALWKKLSRTARVVWIGASVLVLLLAYSPRLLPLFQSEYYLAQARTQVQGKDIAAAQKAVEAFPEYAPAYDALGDAYRRAGDFASALAAYAAALKINPHEMQAHLGRMDVFRQQGDAKQLTEQVRAAGVETGEIELPAPLWWSFDPAPTRLVELGDSTSSFGYILNFHAIQPDGEEKMRFTRDHSYIKFPGVTGWAPTKLVFYARAVPVPNQPLTEATVRLNGRKVARVPLTVQWQDHEIPLDDSVRANDTLVVEFRSPTFRPSDVFKGSEDTRDLGFMLGYVELR